MVLEKYARRKKCKNIAGIYTFKIDKTDKK